jgi:hypothetical protein
MTYTGTQIPEAGTLYRVLGEATPPTLTGSRTARATVWWRFIGFSGWNRVSFKRNVWQSESPPPFGRDGMGHASAEALAQDIAATGIAQDVLIIVHDQGPVAAPTPSADLCLNCLEQFALAGETLCHRCWIELKEPEEGGPDVP